MKKLMIVALVASVAVVGACTRFAAMKGPFDGDSINGAFVEYVTDKADDRLQLDDAQRAELETIIQKMMTKALEQRPQTKLLREAMAAEVCKPNLDMDKMDELMMQRMHLLGAVLDDSRQDFITFHASLDETQRKALAQAILDHGKKGWHGGH